MRKLFVRDIHYGELQKLLREYKADLPEHIISITPIGTMYHVLAVFMGIKPKRDDL